MSSRKSTTRENHPFDDDAAISLAEFADKTVQKKQLLAKS
jgi:hypothetical protein